MTTPENECPWGEAARLRQEAAQRRAHHAEEAARLRAFERSARLALARYELQVARLRVALVVLVVVAVAAGLAVAW